MNIESYFDDVEFFTGRELLRSDTAETFGYEEQYSPPEHVIVALHTLAENLLDPVRGAFGKPIRVTSGYRCERLNNHVGSSDTSHHLRGMAADLTSSDNARLFNELREMSFTQLIWYYEDDAIPSFIHVSYDPDNLKNEVKACWLDAAGTRHYRRMEEK